jgi:2-octaprenyl-6-methoxyphenol hydroxylase
VTAVLECDVLIVGSGLVGSTLAVALASVPLSVVVVEAHASPREQPATFDSRATALANASQRVLDGLGIWTNVAPEAEPITSIHVSERGHFGFSRISAHEEGVPALGYTLENRVLGRALWARLADHENIQVLAPARIGRLTPHEHWVETVLEGVGAERLRARLVIGADGASSGVREQLGIPSTVHDYGQTALIANVTTSERHQGRAFERFTPSGPLALLPLSRSRSGLVWTLAHDDAPDLLATSDADFQGALQDNFGDRLGSIERVGERVAYPLKLVRSKRLSAHRCVLMGNAANSLHPVAGQGFNLALRDVAALADLLSAARDDSGVDPGDQGVLTRYVDWRERDQRAAAWFTHGLVKLFTHPARAVGLARNLGLVAFDILPGAKAQLAKQAMGLAGRLPRLVRGGGLEH